MSEVASLPIERTRRWLDEIGVPRLFRELRYREELLPEAVRAWGDRIPEVLDEGGGMLLAGGAGGGKTAAGVWLLRRLWARTGHTGARRSGRFLRAADVMLAIQTPEAVTRADLRYWAQVDLLVIDDWRAQMPGWVADGLDDLVDRRHADLRPTIVTTNLPAGVEAEEHIQGFERLFPRAASRLLDARGGGLVLVVREDLRR